nr:hypothetical protein [Tanacetum cinerariifolium]
MDMTIDQQVALDEALIPHARRLRIGRSNFHLLSDISSKESTLQLVYDVLRQTPFFKAFMFTADVEHKDTKKSNEMYYLRFTKVIIHHFMSKNISIPRRNKFGAMLPIELTNADIRNSNAYKEYYAVATEATPPKSKASPAITSKAKSLTTLLEVEMIESKHIKLATKRSMQQTYISQASGSGTDQGTGTIPGVLDVPTEEFDEEISWKSSDEGDDGDDDEEGDDGDDDEERDDDDDEEGDDDDQEEGSDYKKASDEEDEEFVHPNLSTHDEEETRDEESFNPILKTPENTNDEGNGKETLGLNVGMEEGQDEEDDADELYRDVNINLEGRGVQMADVHKTQEFKDSHVTLSPVNPDGQQQSSSMDVQAPTTVAPLPVSAPTLTPSTIATITIVQQEPTPSTTAPSTLLQNLPNFGSLFGFDHRLKKLEDKFSEFVQTNQFAGASDRHRDKAQAENEEFLKTIDENMQKIIKEQVKEQVKVQVSKILPKNEQTVNEQLEAEVLTRSSNLSKISYAVAADLFEMELKKILIEKMEGNKSIHRSNEQRNLYKALVEAYEFDKIILDTYGDTVTLKRHRDDDADKDKEPFAGSDRGSKRRREGKEPELASGPKEKATRSDVESTQGESARDVYSKRRIIAVTELKIVEWCVEDLQLDIESYQKKLNLTRLDTYRSDLKRKEAYIAYSNLRGFIYQNKDKQNMLMRIDELHKFSDGTLTDVRIGLDDRFKEIRMNYLPQTI